MKRVLLITGILGLSVMNAQIYAPNGAISGSTTDPSTGNVGIGLSNPTRKLTVVGDIYAGGPAALSFQDDARYTISQANVPTLTPSSISVPRYGLIAPNASGAAELWLTGASGIRMFTGDQTPKFNVLTNGNVGIGILDPASKLDIVTSNNQRILINYNDKSSVSFLPNNGNSWFHISHGLYNDLAISQGSYVDFERLVTIKNTGNVGIGKNEPQARLDVLGSIIVGDNNNAFWYNGADINLKASSRGTGGRAIVHEANNILNLNYAGDFTGGTKIANNVFINNTGDAAFQGKIEAKEVKVTQTPTADFVFEADYNLPTLEEVEKHIKEKKHLPEIASARDMEKEGVNVGEFQIKLLQKIEELTLYTIEQNKQLKLQAEKIEKLEKELSSRKSK